MRAWRLDRPNPTGQLDLSRATGLVAAIGSKEVGAFATEVLKLFGQGVAISQCVIFAYDAGNRPRTLSVAGHRGGRYLREVSDTYAKRFYALDGNQRIFAAAGQRMPGTIVTLHQQGSAEIEHEAYRVACYQSPNVSDRIALLLRQTDSTWVSVNLYRRDGNFQPGEIARIEALAPLVAHAANQHYNLCGHRAASIPELMLTRIHRCCPELSKRELDVLRGVVEGHTAHEIADCMGIKASSVATYLKRAYHRLGISSQRELFALCLVPQI